MVLYQMIWYSMGGIVWMVWHRVLEQISTGKEAKRKAGKVFSASRNPAIRAYPTV
jgi:hypothetical protein